MTIKEFDEKVRVGSEIRYKGKTLKVVDIERREHVAIIGHAKRVRCSEIELPFRECGNNRNNRLKTKKNEQIQEHNRGASRQRHACK